MHQRKKTGVDSVQGGEQGDRRAAGARQGPQSSQYGTQDDLGYHEKPSNGGQDMVLVEVLGLLRDGVSVETWREPIRRPVPTRWMDDRLGVAVIPKCPDATGNQGPFSRRHLAEMALLPAFRRL